jgi:hypothetical protein
MSNKPDDFTSWLLRLVDEQSPVGDLARDVARDETWPESDDEPESLEFYQEYLDSVGSCRGADDALEAAWERYSTGYGRALVGP